MHTTRELTILHDRRGLLEVGTLRVEVLVLDTRQVFGRVDCLVEPVSGSGRQWVSVDRLTECRQCGVLTCPRSGAKP